MFDPNVYELIGRIRQGSKHLCHFKPYYCYILTDYDDCQSIPCQNGGSCNNLFNNFTCDCSDRFEGDVCEKGNAFMVELSVLTLTRVSAV